VTFEGARAEIRRGLHGATVGSYPLRIGAAEHHREPERGQRKRYGGLSVHHGVLAQEDDLPAGGPDGGAPSGLGVDALWMIKRQGSVLR
jgi:hypothetical protein